jgi:two-component system alkaline phosphatase synthesis response regulator PhoP
VARIMIVEDERSISDLIAINLQMTGHDCAQAFCGKDALIFAQDRAYDLMLLDVMLPDIDGFDLLEKMRGVPTIFLTAKHETCDKVRGFMLGADDYITKPFEITELLMRVQAVLRRTKKMEPSYVSGDMVVKFDARKVFLRGEPVELTMQEFTLLQTLIENRNVAMSRRRLLNEAWGIDFLGESRTVDVHVQKIRKKLDLEDRIKTVFKVGYRFED